MTTTRLLPRGAQPVAATAQLIGRATTRARLALIVLLAATALLYLVGLDASGWANAYYSAAAQAASESWLALLFGSTDAANAITVDKPPAALWLMGLATRLFGVSSFVILLPQALLGVASVGMLYVTVARYVGRRAGLLAGVVLALTPVATLIFRFNNPDALLVLLLIIAAYCVSRAVETASVRWLVLAGVLLGTAFLTKMLQAFLVVPGFALVYLLAAPTTVARRIGQLLAAGAAVIAAAGWYVLLVELWPAEQRPYIGGSQTNSFIELIVGYNGFGRITGDEVGSLGGGGFGSDPGPLRLFGTEFGGQIAWLLPAALLAFGIGLWLTRGAPRTDRTRASLLLWGGWLVSTALVFSVMNGIMHAYYMVALAPAIAALTGIGGALCWPRRDDPVVSGVLAGVVAWTGVTGYVLLERAGTALAWLGPIVLFGCLCTATLLLVAPRRTRGIAVLTSTALLLAPLGFSVATAASPQSGALPSAGPGRAQGDAGAGNRARGGGAAGMLHAPEPGERLVSMLRAAEATSTWVAATVGSNSAAGYQLATGAPVLALGGFNGTDPAPTLAEFQRYVAEGQVRYFIGSGVDLTPNGGSDAANQIAGWVADNFASTTVDGVDVYELPR
ncbi:4-amino-4-deoxy-L-arabinose transferase-like glycosyltransferase [Tamaricihabitans halophyticus]|uniref:4-amino-4-deoxy-L-arabinose transferase-like glycosyltransferase n=1 Tax=Tamaricihabitans halophyticus TaxID=1262583 RepID=A0A4R2QN72_9PSEU|nr:glycosyltransferase family 39 protein [Tamaricihabitans halophyticus]TCP50048.1 4-amino-4-deoxy-L-arabinose transferase-like glycosyltransferase [Tamaricihabitans halophyticus]